MGGGGGGSEAEEEEREGICQEGCLSQPLGLFRWAAGLDELKHQNTETYQKRCVSSAVSDEMHSGKGSQGNRQDVDRTQMALAYSLKRLAATAFKRFIFLYFFFCRQGREKNETGHAISHAPLSLVNTTRYDFSVCKTRHLRGTVRLWYHRCCEYSPLEPVAKGRYQTT